MRPKKVLIASLIPCHEPWLARFLTCLGQLDYPKELIRYAFVVDKHIPLLDEWCSSKPNWWGVKQENPPISDRFERLAHLRNIVVEEAHPMVGEDYVLWIDSDVVKMPPNLIKNLMKHDAAVVAPSVYIEGTDQFYDTFAFRTLSGQPFPAWDLPYKGLTEVSSVGTCYMVASRLYYKSKLRYHGGDSEQVTFCRQVRKVGERVYADFNIRIEHANLLKYGRMWH